MILPVQVNGKVRFTIEVPASATRDDIAGVLASHPAYPRDDVARLVIVPGKIASVVLANCVSPPARLRPCPARAAALPRQDAASGRASAWSSVSLAPLISAAS